MMHIFSMKAKTKSRVIQDIPDAPVLYLPLSQYIGSPSIPVVKAGERVLKNQLIAEASGYMSSNMHAPVSGIIKSIKQHPWVDGKLVDTFVLENDFKNEEIPKLPVIPDKLTPVGILEMIKDGGVVGEGGAQFPTHVKYDLQGKDINTFIINGTECEPYLTSDYSLIREKTACIFQGISVINRILCAKDIVISIEEQNKDLVSILNPFLSKDEYRNIRVAVLPNEYPQGGELQLIKSVTGKILPKGILPKDIGVIVSNAGTVNAVYEAVFEQKPLVERIITISGEKSKSYGNFRVKIGTPISHILKYQGFSDVESDYRLVLGGPMMGRNITDFSIPIMKGSSAVLFLQKKIIQRSNCISCGYCVDVCPMHLMPMKFEEGFRENKMSKLQKYNIDSCIECAACEYICPSDVSLMESIKEGKQKIKSLINNAN